MAESLSTLLDSLDPGIELYELLATLDVSRVSDSDRVAVLRAHQRMASHHRASMYAAMEAVTDAYGDLEADPEFVTEAAAAEIRAALVLTRRAADAELELALELRQRLPRLWEALAAGVVDTRRAWVIATGVIHLPDDTARQVVDHVLEEAGGLTTGQLRARLRRLCVETNPEEAQQRYELAVEGRRVVAEPTPDGTAHLVGSDLSPDRVAEVTGRINRIAHHLNTADETRTMDQLRADVFLDLLAGADHGDSPAAVVDIQVDVETLAELADSPAELAGYGPVIADIARQVAAHPNSRLRYTVTDGDQPVQSGVTRRRPTASQRRTVTAANPRCVFPGCRMPASDCDLDHRQAWGNGGPTTADNLAPLCRHDHRLKHDHGWNYQPQPNGDHQWTSPLGHTYTTPARAP